MNHQRLWSRLGRLTPSSLNPTHTPLSTVEDGHLCLNCAVGIVSSRKYSQTSRKTTRSRTKSDYPGPIQLDERIINHQDKNLSEKQRSGHRIYVVPESASHLNIPHFVGMGSQAFNSLLKTGVQPLLAKMQSLPKTPTAPIKLHMDETDLSLDRRTQGLYQAIQANDYTLVYEIYSLLGDGDLTRTQHFTVLRTLASNGTRTLASASRTFHVYQRIRRIYPDPWTPEVLVAMYSLSSHPEYVVQSRQMFDSLPPNQRTTLIYETMITSLLFAKRYHEAQEIAKQCPQLDEKLSKWIDDGLANHRDEAIDQEEEVKTWNLSELDGLMRKHLWMEAAELTLQHQVSREKTSTILSHLIVNPTLSDTIAPHDDHNVPLADRLTLLSLTASDAALLARHGPKSFWMAGKLLNSLMKTPDWHAEGYAWMLQLLPQAPRVIQVFDNDPLTIPWSLMEKILTSLEPQTEALVLTSMSDGMRKLVPPHVFTQLVQRLISETSAVDVFVKQVWNSCEPKTFDVLLRHLMDRNASNRLFPLLGFLLRSDPTLISENIWQDLIRYTTHSNSPTFERLMTTMKNAWLDSIDQEPLDVTWSRVESKALIQRVGLPSDDEDVRSKISTFFDEPQTESPGKWWLSKGFPDPFFKWEYPAVANKNRSSPLIMFDPTWDNQAVVLVPRHARDKTEKELQRLRWIHIHLTELYNAQLAALSMRNAITKGGGLIAEMRSLSLALPFKTHLFQILLVRRLPLTHVALDVYQELIEKEQVLLSTAGAFVPPKLEKDENPSFALVKIASSFGSLDQLYRAMFLVLCRSRVSRDVNQAISNLMNDAQKRNFPLSLQHYGLINRYYVKAGLVDHQAKLMQSLEARGFNHGDDVDFLSQSIMGMLTSHIHDIEDANAALPSLVAACEKTGRFMPVDLFSRFIFENLRKKRYSAAIAWIDAYTNAQSSNDSLEVDSGHVDTFDGMTLNAYMISPVLIAMIVRNDKDAAWNLFWDCIENRKLSRKIRKDLYRVMIKYVCARGDSTMAENLVTKMIDQGLEPDRTIYHALLKAFLKDNLFEKSRQMLRLIASVPFGNDTRGLGRWWLSWAVDGRFLQKLGKKRGLFGGKAIFRRRRRVRVYPIRTSGREQVELVQAAMGTLNQADYRWFMRDLNVLTRVYSRACLISLESERNRGRLQEVALTGDFALRSDDVELVLHQGGEEEGREALQELMKRSPDQPKRFWQEDLDMAISFARLSLDKFSKPISPAARRLLFSAFMAAPVESTAKYGKSIDRLLQASVAWDYLAAKRFSLYDYIRSQNLRLNDAKAVGGYPRPFLTMYNYERGPTAVALRQAILDRGGKNQWMVAQRLWEFAREKIVRVHMYHHRKGEKPNVDLTNTYLKSIVKEGEWFETLDVELIRYMFSTRDIVQNWLDAVFSIARHSKDSLDFCRHVFATCPLCLEPGFVDFGLNVRFANTLISHHEYEEAVRLVTVDLLNSSMWELLSFMEHGETLEELTWNKPLSKPSPTWDVSVGQMEWAWEVVAKEVAISLKESGQDVYAQQVETFWKRRIDGTMKVPNQMYKIENL